MFYKYFFFDFDGMLCDTYDHITSALVKTFKETRGITINYKEAYDKLKITFREMYNFYQITDSEKEKFLAYHEDFNLLPQPTLYLPVKKLLQSIIDSGGKNFIYTNRNESLYEYLEKLGIKEYFTDVIINANKPDPTKLIEMVNKYDLPLNECVVVGDRSIDVDSAYNANMDGILYDVDSRVFMHHATHVIKRINELYNFIDLPYTLKNNYHTHTIRCGHAVGEDEQYIIKAIEAGYQVIGMSDHVNIPDTTRNEEYFDSIALLKEKYKTQIDVKIAMECEWYENYIPYYKKLLKEGKVDYLIFGNHGYLNENQYSRSEELSFMYDYDEHPKDYYLKMYYKCLKKAVESGIFKYICHPDCFLRGYEVWDEKAIEFTHKIAKLLSEHDVYAELSASGVRNRRKVRYNGELYPAYPFIEFYKILKQYDIKFVLGCDAHAPEQVDDYAVKFIRDLAKELQLNVVYTLNDL